MSEYQKMISGELYKGNAPELVRMRKEARELLTQINESVQDSKAGDRLLLCRQLFGKAGSNMWLQPPFYCDYGMSKSQKTGLVLT